MDKKKWLKHVPNKITLGSRNRLSAYLIALEGWRRGLELTWYSKKVKNDRIHSPGRLFSLSSSKRKHYFYKSKGDLTSDKAQKITGNKFSTKKYLLEAGVHTPNGLRFTVDDSDEKIIEYAKELKFPVVLKPTNGYQGIGVFANLKNEKDFSSSLEQLRNIMGYTNVIVEEYIEGTEFRVFVIGDKAVGAIEKIPPIIFGDGKSTVKQLVNKKNLIKKRNPHLYKKLIKFDHEVKSLLNEKGYSKDSILAKNESLVLRNMSSLSSGGEPVDATEKISTKTKKEAIRALLAIPELAQGGIDVIVDNVSGIPYIIEINAIAMIGSHLFPEIGEARDVPKAIIDYYFPETKNTKIYNSDLYFDLRGILRPLMNKSASKVVVSSPPLEGEMFAKKITIDGDVQGVGFRKWLRKKGLENNLHGYVYNFNVDKVIVIVYGLNEDIKRFLDLCYIGPKNAKVKKVEQNDWNNPLKIGFEIKPNRKKVKKASTRKKSIMRRFVNKIMKIASK